ncbi:hypothetical protein [Chroococcidiopsis sp. TS-821]
MNYVFTTHIPVPARYDDIFPRDQIALLIVVTDVSGGEMKALLEPSLMS